MIPRLLATAEVACTRFVTALPGGGWLAADPGGGFADVLSPGLDRLARIPMATDARDVSADFDGRRLAFADEYQVVTVTPAGEVVWRHDTGAADCRLEPDGTLWLTRPGELIAVDAATGRELDRAEIPEPLLTGPGPMVSRFGDTPVRARLAAGRIALQPLGGEYIAGASGEGYLSVSYDDDRDLSWHDLATGGWLAGCRVDEPTYAAAVIAGGYALVNDLLLSTRTLRPVGGLEYPVPTGVPHTSTAPGRWLTVEPVLRLWELAEPPDQLALWNFR